MLKNLLVAALLAFAPQSVYVNPTPPNPFEAGVDQRRLTPLALSGPALFEGWYSALITTPPPSLAAVPNATIGQQAVDSCTAGNLPPIVDQLGNGPATCENQRQPAIQADVVQRLHNAVSTITPTVLSANNLYLAPNLQSSGPAWVYAIYTGTAWQSLATPVAVYDPSLAGVTYAAVVLRH